MQSNGENIDGQSRHGSGVVACLTVALGGIAAFWGVLYGGLIFVDMPHWDYDLPMLAAYMGVPLWGLMLSVLIWVAGSLALRRRVMERVHVDQKKPCVRCSRVLMAAGMAACVVSLVVLISFAFVDVVESITVGFYAVFGIYAVCLAYDFLRQFKAMVRLPLSFGSGFFLTFAVVGVLALALVGGLLVNSQRSRFEGWEEPALAKWKWPQTTERETTGRNAWLSRLFRARSVGWASGSLKGSNSSAPGNARGNGGHPLRSPEGAQ